MRHWVPQPGPNRYDLRDGAARPTEKARDPDAEVLHGV